MLLSADEALFRTSLPFNFILFRSFGQDAGLIIIPVKPVGVMKPQAQARSLISLEQKAKGNHNHILSLFRRPLLGITCRKITKKEEGMVWKWRKE